MAEWAKQKMEKKDENTVYQKWRGRRNEEHEENKKNRID